MFATLLVLTLLAVGVSYMEVSIVVTALAVLGIAAVKGLLEAAVFMHLSRERLWMIVFVGAVAATALGLVVSITLSFYDPITGTELATGARVAPVETVH
jgi:heme/copper-type cytochrome/quinol oxidase subunit 4